MSGFTPGPWSAEDPKQMSVGDVRMYWLNANTSIGTAKHADALLAAAAPDLFDALRKWAAYDDQDEADFAEAGPMLLYAEAINATREALAKALGK